MERHTAEFEIPADLHAMGDLRRRVRAVLVEWGMHRGVVDSAVQTAHEMAVAAMADPVQGASALRLALIGDHLRVEVSGAGAAWSFPRGR